MKGNCEICGKEIDIKMCCNQRDCGCMGRPIDPPVCSEECEKVFKSKVLYPELFEIKRDSWGTYFVGEDIAEHKDSISVIIIARIVKGSLVILKSYNTPFIKYESDRQVFKEVIRDVKRYYRCDH